jgi:tetratricopeptide (TPR) repeat protein
MLWRYAQHFLHSYGELWLARGDLDRAMALANECLERAVATDAPKNVVKARRLRTQVFLARDELSVADEEIDRALIVAKALGNPPQLWRTYATQGDVRRAQGRSIEALVAYRAALAVVDGVARGLADPALREGLLDSTHVQDIRQQANPAS